MAKNTKATTSTTAAAATCMPISAGGMPRASANARKPAASANDTLFEMVIVNRSLEAANAIRAGNNNSRIVSIIAVQASRWDYADNRNGKRFLLRNCCRDRVNVDAGSRLRPAWRGKYSSDTLM